MFTPPQTSRRGDRATNESDGGLEAWDVKGSDRRDPHDGASRLTTVGAGNVRRIAGTQAPRGGSRILPWIRTVIPVAGPTAMWNAACVNIVGPVSARSARAAAARTPARRLGHQKPARTAVAGSGQLLGRMDHEYMPGSGRGVVERGRRGTPKRNRARGTASEDMRADGSIRH